MQFSDYLIVGESKKFNLFVERSVLDPNGHPAYVFVRAEYVPNVDDILEGEAEARRILLDGTAYLREFPFQCGIRD
ncbi:MAG: DTW domain-containing protein [Anaerolineae bacterium]|nr:DTW domain-containing protein [Anaerolineae bacterium]